MSRTRKFFGSAKSATRNVATGFFVPGFGYLKDGINVLWKKTTHSIEFEIKSMKEKLLQQYENLW